MIAGDQTRLLDLQQLGKPTGVREGFQGWRTFRNNSVGRIGLFVVPQGHGSGKRQGLQVPGMRGSAPTRSSAARAAHRDQGRSYICFGPIIPEALARDPLFVPSDIEAGAKVRARMAQDSLAPNKWSDLGRDAPRGRRSISDSRQSCAGSFVV